MRNRGKQSGEIPDSQLPPGISPTNDKQSFGEGGSDDAYVAPDTATPVNLTASHNNSGHNNSGAQPNGFGSTQHFNAMAADNPVESQAFKSILSTRRMIMAITAAGLLTAVLVIAMTNRPEGKPLCSELPHWNQYNCIPG